jgi:hypothetical protein
MTIPRFIIACFSAGVLLVSPATATEQPGTEPNLRDVISRLDETLQRLDQIEQRILRLESMLFRVRLQPDKYGILRDGSGRPIGTWGIDYPTIEARAR